MKRHPIRNGFLVGLLLSLAACISEDEILVDAPAFPTAGDGVPLFSDVVIEYASAGLKWGSGLPLSYHLVSRENGTAEATLILGDPAVITPRTRVVKVESMHVSVARLFEAMERGPRESSQKGCLYPVRARLIRADGILLEREDCRGGAEWTRIASLLVSEIRE